MISGTNLRRLMNCNFTEIIHYAKWWFQWKLHSFSFWDICIFRPLGLYRLFFNQAQFSVFQSHSTILHVFTKHFATFDAGLQLSTLLQHILPLSITLHHLTLMFQHFLLLSGLFHSFPPHSKFFSKSLRSVFVKDS